MKKIKPTDRKRWSWKSVAVECVVGTIILVSIWMSVPKRVNTDPVPIEHATEEFFLSRVTQVDVFPRLHPVLIYQCRDDGNYFCCAGTVYENASGQKALITVEHLFRSEMTDGGIYGIRYLRPASHHKTEFVERIVKTSSQLEDNDIITAVVGNTRTFIPNFSRFVGNKSTGNRFWPDLKVDGKPVTRVRSLLSGEYIQVLGAMEISSAKTKKKLFALANYGALEGESGSGFVDDYGGLYVVHGSFSKDNPGAQEVVKIYSGVIGTNILRGFTILSGPVSPRK